MCVCVGFLYQNDDKFPWRDKRRSEGDFSSALLCKNIMLNMLN